MNLPSRLSLGLLVASWLISPKLGAQQAPEPSSQDATTAIRRSAGVTQLDGNLFAAGPDYKVRVLDGGFEFTPALGRDVERNHPVTFTLESISRGDVRIWDRSWPDAQGLFEPLVEERRIEIPRARGVHEVLHARVEGLEHSFHFDEPLAGRGDLVVRGRLATDLVPLATGAGLAALELALDGVVRVQIQSILGIDADGRRADGTFRFDGEVVEYVLPAAFVDQASYPLILDPLYGGTETIAASFNEEEPSVAYDSATQTYLVAWTRFFSAFDSDIRAQRVALDSGLVGGILTIDADTSTYSIQPSVSSVRQTGQFFVVWSRGLLFGDKDIFGRRVNPTTGIMSGEVVIASTANAELTPCSSGDNTTTDDDVLVIWKENGVGLKGAQVAVPVTNAPVAFGHFNLTTSQNDSWPSLPQACGDDHNVMLVWQRLFPGEDHDPFGMVLSRNGTIREVARPLVSTVGPNEERPAVDGDGRNWMVVYQREATMGDGQADIFAQSYSRPENGGLVLNAGPRQINNTLNNNQRHPDVAWNTECFLAAWMQYDAFFGRYIPVAVELHPFTAEPCRSTFGVGVAGSQHGKIDIATQWGGETAPGLDKGLIIYQSDDDFSTNDSILAQRYVTNVGEVTDLGGETPSGGRAHAPCAIAGNASFSLHLRDSTPTQSVYLIVGASTLGAPCGAGTLIPNPTLIRFVGTTDGNGNLQIFGPLGSSLGGIRFYAQWLTLPGNSECTLGGDLSNGIEVHVD